MKFLAMITAALPAVSAAAVQIREPEILESLREREAAVIRQLANGETIPLVNRAAAHGLDSRAVPIIAGWAIASVGALARGLVDDITDAIIDGFFSNNQEQIWHNKDYCRTYFRTKNGGDCEIRTYEKGAGERTTTHHPEGGCAWPDAPEGHPRSNMFEDRSIGRYSVFFTATNDHTFQGVDDPKKCNFEGLCHPIYIFYRDGYEIVLETWKQQGRISSCQYSDGEDCGGVCNMMIENQFVSGGMAWKGDCAIPCWDEVAFHE